MSIHPVVGLELDDIQAGALQERPTPYAGLYTGLRIDDPAEGRELLRRALLFLDSAASFEPQQQYSLAVGLTYTGLEALGVPQESLESFPVEFRHGMAARADELGDVGENAPEHWESPLGSGDIHVVIVGLAPDRHLMQPGVALARDAMSDLAGVVPIWEQEVGVGEDARNWFGLRDGISQPRIDGLEIAGGNPHETPLKCGEFILGYEDENGVLAPMPEPDVLGRNGTFAAFRKLHMRVAAFRSYLHEHATESTSEEWLAAKMVGRWPSGAPLALAPDGDDPDLGADGKRNNAYLYGDDPQGLKTPTGCHARRMNPRDAVVTGEVRLHRLIRRGTNYGPPLPPGVLEDDGVDRGLMFAFVGARLARQFEFVQKQWVDDGKFIGAPAEKDPLVAGSHSGQFTIPKQPIRRRLQGIPAFVVNRGGEYAFMPGLRALKWITELDA
ncbi:MAG: Dyp-type peroxidase [Solirubrobacterales bacterium]|nr:Dyp-type peroxidase [Solirubrobacterales bacterium]